MVERGSRVPSAHVQVDVAGILNGRTTEEAAVLLPMLVGFLRDVASVGGGVVVTSTDRPVKQPESSDQLKAREAKLARIKAHNLRVQSEQHAAAERRKAKRVAAHDKLVREQRQAAERRTVTRLAIHSERMDAAKTRRTERLKLESILANVLFVTAQREGHARVNAIKVKSMVPEAQITQEIARIVHTLPLLQPVFVKRVKRLGGECKATVWGNSAPAADLALWDGVRSAYHTLQDGIQDAVVKHRFAAYVGDLRRWYPDAFGQVVKAPKSTTRRVHLPVANVDIA